MARTAACSQERPLADVVNPWAGTPQVQKSESHRTEDVLMLFRYTENPPENAIFTPGALRVSVVVSAYTENSSFPYIPNVVALPPAALLLLITFPDLPPKEPV